MAVKSVALICAGSIFLLMKGYLLIRELVRTRRTLTEAELHHFSVDVDREQ